MSEHDQVCERIKNLRRSISNAFATRSRGNTGWMLDQLDVAIDRKRHLESFKTIPESEFTTQRG